MGPKKKAKSKTGGKKDKKSKDQELVPLKLASLLKDYERQCVKLKSTVDSHVKSSLQTCISESKILVRFILQGFIHDTVTIYDENGAVQAETVVKVAEKLPIKISPLFKALRLNWYKDVKELYFWDLDIPREEITEMNEFFNQPCYPVEYLEMLDCKIDLWSIKDLSLVIGVNQSLSSLVLDYTNLQLDGLLALCDGFSQTRSLTKLSLCYCNLCSKCGRPLGDLIAQTSICELYIDGNNIECSGMVQLLFQVVDQAEEESIERKSPKKNEFKSAVGLFNTSSSATVVGTDTSSASINKTNSATTKTKKKKGKKKKSKTPKVKMPPKVGAWLNILHAVNVGIDGMSITEEKNLLYEVVILISRWIMFSEDLKEIDIEDNLIGEFGGREILTALQQRKQDGLKPIYIKVSNRINSDVFKEIVSLASGSSKRGGKKKKGKKGKPGKRRV